MSNINREYSGPVRRSTKHWAWYHERLPKYLRELLANADHNWSDEQVYWLWKGSKKEGIRRRSPVEIVAIIEGNEEQLAYNWAPELKEAMNDTV